MTTTINASPTNGLVQTADGSGVLKVQSNGVTTNALAWVNYNGGTQVIRSSYNVSSVTRVSTGVYTVNFANALADTNYIAVGMAGGVSGYTSGYLLSSDDNALPRTTSSIRFYTYNISGVNTDSGYMQVAIFGN